MYMMIGKVSLLKIRRETLFIWKLQFKKYLVLLDNEYLCVTIWFLFDLCFKQSTFVFSNRLNIFETSVTRDTEMLIYAVSWSNILYNFFKD